MSALNIEPRKLSELKPYPENPRTITNDALDRLKKSLREFGLVEPLVINPEGQVIGGNQRLCALQELGVAEVPTVVVSLPKAKERALNIALNKASGAWDKKALAAALGEIADEMDIELTGFATDEMNELESELQEVTYIAHDPNAANAATSPWARIGDKHDDLVLFSFGALACNVPREVYEQFIAAVPETNVAEWVSEVLSHAYRNL